MLSYDGIMTNPDLAEGYKDFDSARNTIKIAGLNVNIRNSFNPEKGLYGILFSIAIARLKEKSE